MKKKLSVMLSAIMMCVTILGGISTVSAEVNSDSDELFTQEQYDEGIREGWIEEDTSLEDIQQLNRDSARLEEELENDPSFYEVKTNTFRAGDIIVTNGVKVPLAGHAGIFVGKNTILHIAGPKKHPKTLSFSSWKNSYNKKAGSWTKVYRSTTSSYGPAASNWAMKHYYGSNAEYVINQDLKSTSKTYCSKIVYQAYYYGAGSKSIINPMTRGIIPPYDLRIVIRNCALKHTYN